MAAVESRLAPGLLSGLYPEKAIPRQSALADWQQLWQRRVSALNTRRRYYQRDIARINQLVSLYAGLSHRQMMATGFSLRRKLSTSGMTAPLKAQALALVSEAIFRSTGMRAYDNQLMAALVMLNGRLAEMATGEGKTLSTILAAGTAALAGIPTHVLTANDYLVARDGEQAAEILKLLGLSVGRAITGQDPDARQQQYACDITYSTAKEVVFDYLKDLRIRKRTGGKVASRAGPLRPTHGARHKPLLRGLCFALVDEADSIFLDEATTPLILSRPGKTTLADADYSVALRIAIKLDRNLHYEDNDSGRGYRLTVAGQAYVKQAAVSLTGLWNVSRFRDFLVTQALAALHLYDRGRDYVVRDGKVEIVDQNTGRIAEGRQWNNGLHQLVELKENCDISPQNETVAQITYQTFFPRYLKLGGTSATLHEASAELLDVYGMVTESIPRHKTAQFKHLGVHVYTRAGQRWNAVVLKTRKALQAGKPVLIGTDSINATEHVSQALDRAGIGHTVLTADQDDEEARIIAKAGCPGHVTVTTNMAGRGTDIKITESVRRAGGLHVINCQFNGSGRIDRQLLGRSARQGDPGSGETLLALDDLMFQRYLPIGIQRAVAAAFRRRPRVPAKLAYLLTAWIRASAERSQREIRKQLRQSDKQMRDWLALSGAGE